MLTPFNPYQKLPSDIAIFDEASLLDTEKLAASLSMSEVLDYFGISTATLDNNLVDKVWFESAYRRGKSIAKFKASEVLFKKMDEKGGSNIAMSYLKQMADEWEGADSTTTSGGSKYSFSVVLEPEEK